MNALLTWRSRDLVVTATADWLAMRRSHDGSVLLRLTGAAQLRQLAELLASVTAIWPHCQTAEVGGHELFADRPTAMRLRLATSSDESLELGCADALDIMLWLHHCLGLQTDARPLCDDVGCTTTVTDDGLVAFAPDRLLAPLLLAPGPASAFAAAVLAAAGAAAASGDGTQWRSETGGHCIEISRTSNWQNLDISYADGQQRSFRLSPYTLVTLARELAATIETVHASHGGGKGGCL